MASDEAPSGTLFAPRDYARTVGNAGSLTLLTFITRLPGQSPADFFDWYEGRHAPDFLAFAAPHMARYGRNHVTSGDPAAGFDVITEFVYRSADDQAAVMRLLAEPASEPLRTGPRGASRSVSIPMTERLIAGPPRGADPPGTARHAVLLKAAGADFATSAAGFAGTLAGRFAAAAARITLYLAVPGAEGSPPVDGVVMIWPAEGPADLPLPLPSAGPGLTVVGGVDLAAYEAVFG